MKQFSFLLCCLLMFFFACTIPQTEKENTGENAVIENIITRRSIRKYQPQAVNRDTMQIITECGINAPNALNRQSWEVRVVDNPKFINELVQIFAKANPDDPNMQNVFRGAPTIAFVAHDTTFEFSSVDCGLLSANMVLSAWSLGIGSVCLGRPVSLMNTLPEAEAYLKQLGFSENYKLLLCVGFGYPLEKPSAKPRDKSKVKFID